MEKIKSFTDLKVWQEGHILVVLVYEMTGGFPQQERYSLIDQMRRSSSSVTSNIAEGFGRQTLREKIHFYYFAQGSLTELKNQFFIAKDVGYISDSDFQSIMEKADNTHRLLQGLIKKSRSFLNLKS